MLPAHLGPQALGLNTEMVWGNISKTILKDKEMSKNLRRMTDILLNLSNITKAAYPGFCKGHQLLQIQLIQAHVWDLSDLEDMDERGTAKMLGHMEGRIVCAAIKVVKFMRIEKRERFMQDHGFDIRMCQRSWCTTLPIPMTLTKIILTIAQNLRGLFSLCLRQIS